MNMLFLNLQTDSSHALMAYSCTHPTQQHSPQAENYAKSSWVADIFSGNWTDRCPELKNAQRQPQRQQQ